MKAKKIVRISIAALLVYLFIESPKKDYADKQKIQYVKNNTEIIYDPETTAYIVYMVKWWQRQIDLYGINGIMDEKVLGSLGIKFNSNNEQ